VKYLVLAILAIIGYLLYKKLGSKSAANTESSINAHTKEIGQGGTPAAEQQNRHSRSSLVSDNTDNTMTRTNVTSTSSINSNGLMPDSGNLLVDIQEMFKILNLRASDSPRLGLTGEQFDQIKQGRETLSDDVMQAVLGKLKAMI